MSEQGWLKREMEVVQCEVATWPAWKRGEGMKDAKRYKLCQDVCYDDGAFVIPAGQVMVREADYDALRDECERLRKALEVAGDDICSEFCGSGPCHKKCLAVQAALQPERGAK